MKNLVLTKISWMIPLLSAMACAAAAAELTVGGSPAAVGVAGEEYRFLPLVENAHRSELDFSYINKPDWTKTYRSSGLIMGTPDEPGVYANIRIGVWDGVQYAVTPPFSITILPPPVSAPDSGVAYLSWIKPAYNGDGSALTNLSGYLIRYGNRIGSWRELSVADATSTAAQIDGLTPGTWYFEIAAFNTADEAGNFSTVVEATLR